MHTNIREIPYNYTSFSDREITIRLLGKDVWQMLEQLQDRRRTGHSARMLLVILGDMWVIKRNPYIQDDLLNNHKRRAQLYLAFNNKLASIINRATNNDQLVLQLISAIKKSITEFQDWLEQKERSNKQVFKALNKITHHNNICFDGLSRVSHVTDASDWRVEYPQVVITPDTEAEVMLIVKTCSKLKMNIIPRGGGTGYTGGAVPMVENTAIINTEKLHDISTIKFIQINQQNVATITVGAGTITKQVSNIATANNLVFAVDPTSQDASTIGGNVATNAGGKKAVMWGTTIDNLLAWRMVMPDATWLEVSRENNNLGKIHDLPNAVFKVSKLSANHTVESEYVISLTAEEIRKPGLGKDVTNKILGKLPGVQKEGCDGIITSATFVLHHKFNHTHTLCMEFFNHDLSSSVMAINKIIELVKAKSKVNLTGLEHLDARYIKAVGYSSKSNQSRSPRMLLLADVAADKVEQLATAAEQISQIVLEHDGETFIATTTKHKAQFWSERAKTAAIASHTNAFKINEDVVIPLNKLAEYSTHIETINIEQSIINKLVIINGYQTVLEQELSKLSPDNEINTIAIDKIKALTKHLNIVSAEWQLILDNFDLPDSELAIILSGKKIISLQHSVQTQINQILSGTQWQELRQQLKQQHKVLHTNRLVVATHMHAGDGNVHTNIPVHSNDYVMLHRAGKIVDKIMQIAQDLGGVISGEHGIGLTKIKYLKPQQIADFVAYKRQVDPENIFNRHKLTDADGLSNAYTPSLRLLEMEALILAESELGELNHAIKDCLRCGKCKPVCATHVPRANLLYSPRNKILATGLLTEAFLYEEQTKRGISSKHFAELNDIADHCTVCHQCLAPCPVNIDFGEVSVLIRRLLKKQGKREFNLGSKIGMLFLNISEASNINLLRNIMIRLGYKVQRLASKFFKPAKNPLKNLPNTISTANKKNQIVQFLKNPMPKEIPAKTMRAMLEIEDKNIIPIISKSPNNLEAVFYFPGCGSERLFSQIGLGTIKWLYELNYATILPPGYLCCGYPQMANGDANDAGKISTQNRVLFHQIAKTLNYLNIGKIVVSCGTCLDQMLTYELELIFPQAKIVDISELLIEHNKTVNSSHNNYLFHEPCHSPTKSDTGVNIAHQLLNAPIKLTDRCCGESGTFAVARPDIAAQVKYNKVKSLVSVATESGSKPNIKKVLTNCPSCLQGLSRLENQTGVSSDYTILEMAKLEFGKNWGADFAKQLANNKIERVLL